MSRWSDHKHPMSCQRCHLPRRQARHHAELHNAALRSALEWQLSTMVCRWQQAVNKYAFIRHSVNICTLQKSAHAYTQDPDSWWVDAKLRGDEESRIKIPERSVTDEIKMVLYTIYLEKFKVKNAKRFTNCMLQTLSAILGTKVGILSLYSSLVWWCNQYLGPTSLYRSYGLSISEQASAGLHDYS